MSALLESVSSSISIVEADQMSMFSAELGTITNLALLAYHRQVLEEIGLSPTLICVVLDGPDSEARMRQCVSCWVQHWIGARCKYQRPY